MKRHAEQRIREAALDSILRERTIERVGVGVPFVDFQMREPGIYGCVLALRAPYGEQHNYAFTLSPYEAANMGFDPQSRERELMDDCRSKEKAVFRKREAAVKYLSDMIARGMIDWLEKNDPQFGYDPKQWREMSR